MEELGLWELIHGTSAGCASIVAFESMREVMHGPALLAIYGVVAFGLFKVQQWHLRRIKARKHCPPPIPDLTRHARMLRE